MTKRIISVLLSLICVFSLFTACKKGEPQEESNVVDLPVAEANPNITKPQGEFFETSDGLYAVGGLAYLGKDYDFLKIMIEGKEWEFALSEEAKHHIEVYNKDPENLQIMKGTMLQIKYEKKDLIFVATEIGIVTAN